MANASDSTDIVTNPLIVPTIISSGSSFRRSCTLKPWARSATRGALPSACDGRARSALASADDVGARTRRCRSAIQRAIFIGHLPCCMSVARRTEWRAMADYHIEWRYVRPWSRPAAPGPSITSLLRRPRSRRRTRRARSWPSRTCRSFTPSELPPEEEIVLPGNASHAPRRSPSDTGRGSLIEPR